MTITKTLSGDTLTITVDGWLDTMTSPEFHDQVQDLGKAKNVILDFGKTEYISSAGLREIVALFRTITGRGGSFSIRKVAPGVRDVFTLTGFDKTIAIYPD